MSRYIALNKVLSELGLDHKDYVYIDKHEVAERIKKIPSIDIVRCAECKYWEESQYYQEFMVCTYVKGATFTRQHDDYCSRGERKESE